MKRIPLRLILFCLFLSLAAIPTRAQETPPPPPPYLERQALWSLKHLPHLPENQRQLPQDAERYLVGFGPWSEFVFQFLEEDGTPNWEIVTHTLTGRRALTDHPANDIHPRLNRGATHVAFASDRAGNLDIYVVPFAGGNPTQLTSHKADDANPAWSPDGGRILFESDRDGQSEIYVMDTDGANPTRLTTADGYDGRPTWSPDGAQIVFSSDRLLGVPLIWVMNADGSEQRQLSAQPVSLNPAWSPDGALIAYDADADLDGWQELWVMNADGSDPQMIYDPAETQSDVWARSWTPDGRYIAFTRIDWIKYQGEWYWTYAYIMRWDRSSGVVDGAYNFMGTDWLPDYATTDLIPPITTIQPLPAQTPGRFTVAWSGVDPGNSGIHGFDVQVRSGDDQPWTDWFTDTLETAATFQGAGGATYAFRARARDYAFNQEAWPVEAGATTTVEALPPQTTIHPLPTYQRGNVIWVQWSGEDVGGSGITQFQVQTRTGGDGDWEIWLSDTLETSGNFNGDPGVTYGLRVRAQDGAGNWEAWPAGDDGEAQVTFYTWGITGAVRDNVGTLLAGIQTQTQPSPFEIHASDENGLFAAYVAPSSPIYTATWQSPDHGSPLPRTFGEAEDAFAEVILPPLDNRIVNGEFEKADLSGWQPGGEIPPTIGPQAHSGNAGAILGCQDFNKNRNLSGIPSSQPGTQVVMDDEGVLHVAWLSWDEANQSHIRYTRRALDGVWSPLEIIGSRSGRLENLSMAVDGTGVPHVVWTAPDSPPTGAFYSQRNPTTGAWSEPQPAMTESPVYHAQILAGANNTIHALWLGPSGEGVDLFYALRDGDGVWNAAHNISQAARSSLWLRAAVVGDGGVLHLLWHEIVGNPAIDPSRMVYAQRSADGAWSEPTQLSDQAIYTNGFLATQADGALMAVWTEGIWTDGAISGMKLISARRAPDGMWDPPVSVDGANYTYMNALGLVADAGNRLHLLWEGPTEESARGFLFYSLWDNGAWTLPDPIPDGTGVLVSAALGVDPAGRPHVVWPRWGDNMPADIHYTTRTHEGAWTSAQNLSRTPQSSHAPQLVAGPDGAVHLIWREADSFFVAGHIYHRAIAYRDAPAHSTLSQGVSLPAATPVLSFLYQFQGSDGEKNALRVTVQDALTVTTVLSLTDNQPNWSHAWADLSAWAGETITLTLAAEQDAGYACAWGWVDEVSLGTAHTDVWIEKKAPLLALPGESVIYALRYGNRSALPARQVTITDSLPDGLAFVAADPAPTLVGSTLTWMREQLATTNTGIVVITATLAADWPLMLPLTNTVSIVTETPELAWGNNTVHSVLLPAYGLYLPLINRD